jgi:hypothetical protein
MFLGVGSRSWKFWAGLQILLGAASLLILAFYPPAHGRMLLVPLNGVSVNEALTARLMLYRVGQGPLPGSVLVDGPGLMMAAALLREGVVPLGAPQVLCSTASPAGEIA